MRQVAEDLVCRDVVETEPRPVLAGHATPVLERCRQQAEGADDVGLDKGRRSVDRAVDMALCGQVDHRVDRLLAQQRRDCRGIADVGLHEAVVRVVLDLPKRRQIAGIGQLVDIGDPVAGRRAEVPA